MKQSGQSWCAGIVLAALAVAHGAAAQGDPPADPAAQTGTIAVEDARAESAPPVDEDFDRVLPEIIVTAQKVEQTLQEVPASVSTLDRELVRDSGAFGLPDLQNYAPNIQIRLTPATSDIYIRGFGTASTNAGFEPSVGSVIDGVFYGRSNFLAAFFHDIDRIEVLRGPQGTLFGKNSTAGILNLVTEAPREELAARAEILYGDYGERSFRPAISAPLLPGLSLRLSGNYSANPGILHNTLLDRPEYNVDQQSTRLRARWAPGGDWSLDLAGFTSRQTLNNGVFQLSHLVDDMLALVQQYDPLAEGSAFNFLNSNNVASLADVSFDGASATLDIGLDALGLPEVTLTSISAWARTVTRQRDIDADFSPVPFIRDSLVDPSPFRQLSQELRLAGTLPSLLGWGHGLDFVLGLYGFDAQMSANDLFQLEDLGAAYAYVTVANANAPGSPGTGGGLGTLNGQMAGPLSRLVTLLDPALAPVIGDTQSSLVRLNQRTEARAAFAQVEHRFAEHWALIGGLRYGIETKRGDAHNTTQGRLLPLFTTDSNGNATVVDHDSELDREERELSPKAGLKWAPNPALNVYATWSRGFKSGGFNALPINPNNLEFEPERATSFELGAKANLLGGSMRAGAALFSTDFEDLQVSTFQDASFYILNAAEARSRGLELDLHWLPPLPGTSLFTSLGYIDARYTSYPDAPAPADGENDTQDLSGQRLAISPRWSATLVPSFTMLLPSGRAGATLAVDVLYRGERYLDVDLDERTSQPATTEINARLSFGTLDRAWQLTLAGRNLTDETILEQVLDQPLAPGNFAAIRADRGRFYSANLSLAF